ncbi:hypothetical protein BKA70DRAFT_94092 [Coprinopsis sp. MPI-PUGE-AT-0042]|nr:hypothetical protein BKA70DRAFT_94092 [Coprinopsis sp. MPI-PUGE-AT-0042]
MAGPLMLLASPLAIVAYYMLASVLTSYIAIRLIRTWGLVGRLVATFSRKERLPISLPESTTPALATSSWRERAQTSYIEWTAKLFARLKVPIPRLPHRAHQRIELPILKEDETVQLEEARLAVEGPAEPPPLVDLADTISPMLGVFAGTSNVSACPTPDVRFHRHLPSPIPWRPGTTPPFSSTSSRFSTDSPQLPTTPPPTFAPLSPFASPKHMLQGSQRESFEMSSFSQPLIQFSPVASPVPRVLFPPDRTRTPSPVQYNPHFLSTSPPSAFRTRRAMSLGGVAAPKVPLSEVGIEERIDGAWEPGRSNLMIDLERFEYDTTQPTIVHYQMPTPIKTQAAAAFSLEVEDGARRDNAPQSSTDQEPGGLLPAFGDAMTMLDRQDGEFGLFDNPFNTGLERLAAATVPSPTALHIDWDMDCTAHSSSSSLISTPVVVDYADTISIEETSPQPESGASTLENPSQHEATRLLEQEITAIVVDAAHLSLEAMESGTDAEALPDPDDIPLPSDQDFTPRFPDPELPELPSQSDIQHAGLLFALLCSLAPIGHPYDEDPLEVTEDEICDPTLSSLSMSIAANGEPAIPLPETTAVASGNVPVPAMNIAIVQPDLVSSETPNPSIKPLEEVSQEVQRATVEQSPEPVASQGSKENHVGPTAVSDASPPIVSPSDAAKSAKPRHRALSGGFSATIAETWRRGKMSPLDIALAMQMRPGLGVGADPAFMVRFLMAAFGWFVIVVNGGID